MGPKSIYLSTQEKLRSPKLLLSVSEILQVWCILLFCSCTTLSRRYRFHHFYQGICHFPSSQLSDISLPLILSSSYKAGNTWITRHISYVVPICLGWDPSSGQWGTGAKLDKVSLCLRSVENEVVKKTPPMLLITDEEEEKSFVWMSETPHSKVKCCIRKFSLFRLTQCGNKVTFKGINCICLHSGREGERFTSSNMQPQARLTTLVHLRRILVELQCHISQKHELQNLKLKSLCNFVVYLKLISSSQQTLVKGRFKLKTHCPNTEEQSEFTQSHDTVVLLWLT